MTPVRPLCLALVMVAAAAPAVALAQQDRKNEIPPAYKPPAGMCRIWVDGVPPDKQPASTDCPAALKNKPVNGRVVFGESASSAKGGPAAAMSRTLTPPLNGGVSPPAASRLSRDVPVPIRSAPKSARDTTKAGTGSTAKKPPPGS